MKVDLTDKVALITGATGEVGHATALAFARNGADIVINGIDENNAQKIVEEVKEIGREAVFIKADIGDATEVEALVAKAVGSFGKVDILVNITGINSDSNERKPIHELDDEYWKKTMNVGLNGVYFCCKAALKDMVTRGCGKIVNITSAEGLVPVRNKCANAAATAGVVHLTKTMAIEMASNGINVNAILLGSVKNESGLEGIMSHVPQKGQGTPGDAANTALFFASDASHYSNGSIVTVDGGWTCAFTRDW